MPAKPQAMVSRPWQAYRVGAIGDSKERAMTYEEFMSFVE